MKEQKKLIIEIDTTEQKDGICVRFNDKVIVGQLSLI
jgi:hypothetical protein